MAENSWAERRGRMVKCKPHGLHYDPEMSTGCTLCLRDAGKAQRASRPPQLVLILLCLLGMAGILFYLFGPGQDEARDIIDLGVASNAATAAPKLDPEAYRTPVIDLETALFHTSLEETEDLLIVSGDVQTAADDLSAAILRDQPVHGLTAADQIARMGQAMPVDQVVVADIQKARRQWSRIRKQRFQSAEWFSDLSVASTRSGPSVSDYSDVASSVRALIEDGAAEAEALSEPADEPGVDLDLRWRNFASGWQEELDSLESRLSNRPDASASGELLVAVTDLEQAISQARSLATSAQTPAATDSRFEEAINAALRAQQAFDGLAP